MISYYLFVLARVLILNNPCWTPVISSGFLQTKASPTLYTSNFIISVKETDAFGSAIKKMFILAQQQSGRLAINYFPDALFELHSQYKKIYIATIWKGNCNYTGEELTLILVHCSSSKFIQHNGMFNTNTVGDGIKARKLLNGKIEK